VLDEEGIAMTKKALKGTKGGAVDAFIWFNPTESVSPTQNLKTAAGDVNGLNFTKP
jgi:hypothetical protein